VTFQDSTGEDPQAPDIAGITVSNTDAGLVSFKINIPNRPQFDQDMLIELYVDSDFNTATGDPELGGTDYAIQLLRGDAALYKWDGTNFTRRFGDPSAVTLSFSYATGDIDGTNARADFAPGGGAGLYPFEVKTAPPKLEVRSFTHAPARPRAGKPFSLKMTVARSDTGAVLLSGRVTCVARIGSSRLRSTTARVVKRAVTCTWNIPAAATGKTFRGSATIVFEGLKASRSYSAKIG
jgi:hypothetical protein